MATPNYGYEKRQKELAKKRKKEEKAAKKAAGGGEDELTPNEAAMALPPAGQAGPDEGDEADADRSPDEGADEGDKPPAAG